MDGILAMFAKAPIVAIGERHGWTLQHDFFAELVCDPRFAATVDDIVVEFGNSRLQAILDAYVNGENDSAIELASVWRESTQRSGVWDHPVYRRFFGLIRTVNATLPPEQRIRVLAGDPPIDYREVAHYSDCSDVDPACYEYWLQRRDRSFADVVSREVIARGRSALLVAGIGHMERRTDGDRPASIPQILEVEHGIATFVVIPHLGFGQADPASERRFETWPAPGIGWLKAGWLGALDACLLEADVGRPPTEPCKTEGDAVTIGDVADAYLYLGAP